MAVTLPSSVWNHLKGQLVGVNEPDMALINQFSIKFGVDTNEIICALDHTLCHLDEVP